MAGRNLPDSPRSGMVSDDNLGEVVDENSLDLVPFEMASDDEEPYPTQSIDESESGTYAEEQSSISQPRRLHPFSTRTRARVKTTPRVIHRVGPRVKGMKSKEELNQHCTRCDKKGHICVDCPEPIIYRWWWDPVCRANIEAFMLRKRLEEEKQRKAEMQDGFYAEACSGMSSEAESDYMSCDKPN